MKTSWALGVGLVLLVAGLLEIAATTHGTRNIGLWLAVAGAVLVLASGVGNAVGLWRRL